MLVIHKAQMKMYLVRSVSLAIIFKTIDILFSFEDFLESINYSLILMPCYLTPYRLALYLY